MVCLKQAQVCVKQALIVDCLKQAQTLVCVKQAQIVDCLKQAQTVVCVKQAQIVDCLKQAQIVDCLKPGRTVWLRFFSRGRAAFIYFWEYVLMIAHLIKCAPLL